MVKLERRSQEDKSAAVSHSQCQALFLEKKSTNRKACLLMLLPSLEHYYYCVSSPTAKQLNMISEEHNSSITEQQKELTLYSKRTRANNLWKTWTNNIEDKHEYRNIHMCVLLITALVVDVEYATTTITPAVLINMCAVRSRPKNRHRQYHQKGKRLFSFKAHHYPHHHLLGFSLQITIIPS